MGRGLYMTCAHPAAPWRAGRLAHPQAGPGGVLLAAGLVHLTPQHLHALCAASQQHMAPLHVITSLQALAWPGSTAHSFMLSVGANASSGKVKLRARSMAAFLGCKCLMLPDGSISCSRSRSTVLPACICPYTHLTVGPARAAAPMLAAPCKSCPESRASPDGFLASVALQQAVSVDRTTGIPEACRHSARSSVQGVAVARALPALPC